jgi:stearoyl-CoA desaturase (Delta-9 desaturase)
MVTRDAAGVVEGPAQIERSGTYERFGAVPFIIIHLLPLLAFWTGTKWQDWAVCAALYWIRMFGVTGAYHRYFAHRTYKTSRVFQFILAFLAETSSQKGALWWASHHRTHHRLSDQEGDPHNSRRGFWFSHVLWMFQGNSETDYSRIKDMAKYPELVWLNRHWLVPPTLLGVAVFLIWGLSGLLIGFFLSTVLLWHGTFTINSLSHIFGSQRYESGDESRNNWLLAIITMGEGWHNNHHHYMGSTRQGFYWWEYDVTYYVIRALGALRLVWDIREPPARVYDKKTHKAFAAQGAAVEAPAATDAAAVPVPPAG